MFALTRPCSNCPFRKGQGELFQLGAARLEEIFRATSFQCHKTVDYDHFDNARMRQGRNPQQCAGVMSLLWREGTPNQIMQIAERLGHWDPLTLDHSEVYSSTTAAIVAHGGWRVDVAKAQLQLPLPAQRAKLPNFKRAWR